MSKSSIIKTKIEIMNRVVTDFIKKKFHDFP